jgi:hypothetical protein
MTHVVSTIAVISVCLCVAAPAPADSEQPQSELELLREELEILKRRDAEREARLQALEERLAAAEARKPAPTPEPEPVRPAAPDVAASDDLWSQPVGADAQLRLMDIGVDIIGVGGFSSVDDSFTGDLQGGAHDPFQRGFSFSQLELSLRGAVDPYFRAEAYVIFQVDGEGETLVELEEAFAVTQALPFGLDELGFEIEAGTFFTEFGRKNPTHPHTWFWVDQPFINTRMFGGDGLRGPGVRIGWLTPLPWYSEVHVGMQNARGETQVSFLANDEVFEERAIGGRPFANDDVHSLEDFIYLMRWVNAFEAGDEWSVLLGGGALFGPNPTGSGADTMIVGGDLTLKWHPLQTDRGWPYLRSTTEFLYRNYEAAAYRDGAARFPSDVLDDWGLYTELVWGFVHGWTAGIRYGYGDGHGIGFDENANSMSRRNDPFRDRRHRVSPVLVWDPSEYSRIRLQYNFDHAQHLDGNTAHSVWLGLEFSMGAHPAHEY